MHYLKSKFFVLDVNKENDQIIRDIQICINDAERILLQCHVAPDPDSIGSVLAVKEYLIGIGKDVTAIIGDSGYPSYSKLLNLEKEITNKNIFDIDLNKFDLFIILDTASQGQVSRKGDIQFPSSMKTVVIDHHITNTKFGDINLILDNYASTTHILYDLFKLWNVNISKRMAECLIIGIYFDTGGFKYSNSTPKALEAAAQLALINRNYTKTVFNIENSRRPIEIEMMGLALSLVKKFDDGKIVFSEIPYSVIQERNISENDAMEGLIPDILRSVVGWDIVASLVEAKKGVTTVSLRTRNDDLYDMSKVAKAIDKNGGGHRGAAGVTVLKDIDETERELLVAIHDLYK